MFSNRKDNLGLVVDALNKEKFNSRNYIRESMLDFGLSLVKDNAVSSRGKPLVNNGYKVVSEGSGSVVSFHFNNSELESDYLNRFEMRCKREGISYIKPNSSSLKVFDKQVNL